MRLWKITWTRKWFLQNQKQRVLVERNYDWLGEEIGDNSEFFSDVPFSSLELSGKMYYYNLILRKDIRSFEQHEVQDNDSNSS